MATSLVRTRSAAQSYKAPNLFNNALLSDITIRYGTNTISAHKYQLIKQSGYFYTAFTCRFCSSTNPEIDLGDEDDPNLIRAMLRHLYDLPYEYQYDEDVPAPTSQMLSEDPLNFYLEMFTLADKYDIPSLRDGAVEKFDCILRDAMGDKRFASTIQRLFSCMYADRRLQDVTLQFMAENFSAILQESQGFREMLETGTLLDTEIAAKLALKMGAKMQALETRAIPQYQGYADFGSSPQR